MRDITPASVIAATSSLIRPVTEVTSWLGAQYLGEVPVMGGSATSDLTLIGGELELQAPNIPEWVPTSPDHPLANNGQELLVRRGWADAQGNVQEWATIGRYLIHRSIPEGDVITVRADGLGQRIEHDRFTDPFTITAGNTFTQARALLQGTGLPVILTPGFSARASVARSWERGGSRVEAWGELMTAWPAVSYIDPDSRAVIIRPPYPTMGEPVMHLTDGVAGSVVDVSSGGGPADGAPNGVVASSAPEDGSVPLSAIATLMRGPRRWTGPYGRRPQFYASPLLTTRQQVAAAASTRLNNLQAETWDLTIDIASCPALERGDLIAVTSTEDDTDIEGLVVSVRVALTPEDEPGQASVQALRGRLGGVRI